MGIEPRVLESIRSRRRKILWQEAGVLAMLAAGVAALLILVIVPFSLGSTSFSPLVRASGMSGLVWTGLVIAIVVGVGGLALYLIGRHRDTAFYRNFTRRTGDYDMASLGRFMNALEGVALDSGLEAPYVAVLANPVPNAVAFEGDEGLVIGVTSGALEAGLEYSEAGAVMAHELSAVLTGDYLKPPGSAKFEGASLALLWLLAVLGILSVPVSRRGNSSLVAFGVAVVIVALLLLAALWLRRLRTALSHDYILADSVAVEMTGDAESMRSAIEKMDGLVNRRGRAPFPESELGIRYLFAPPRRFSEDAMSFLKRKSEQLDYALNEKAARRRADALEQEMEELAEWSRQLLSDRLDNLSAIEGGKRPLKERPGR